MNPLDRIQILLSQLWNSRVMPLYMIGKKKITPHTYQLTRSIKLKLREDSVDSFIVHEIFDKKTYQLPGFEIGPTNTIVDIGAQIGTFSTLAASLANKGKVFSYEPEPGNFKLLSDNKKLNNLQNLTLHNLAVTSDGQTVNLHLSTNSGGHSVLPIISASTITVKSHSLKQAFSTNKISKVNLLKIDTEGSEYDLILNSPKDLFDKIDKIILEYHNAFKEHHYKQLILALRSYGFRLEFKENFFDKIFSRTGHIFATKIKPRA